MASEVKQVCLQTSALAQVQPQVLAECSQIGLPFEEDAATAQTTEAFGCGVKEDIGADKQKRRLGVGWHMKQSGACCSVLSQMNLALLAQMMLESSADKLRCWNKN